MHRASLQDLEYQTVELGGIRYVILSEAAFRFLCQKAELEPGPSAEHGETPEADLAIDGATLAEKLIRRRQAAGMSQAELARRAGVRPETLNRIERGRTTPDFATIRKLVVAMNAADQERLAKSISQPRKKENQRGNQH